MPVPRAVLLVLVVLTAGPVLARRTPPDPIARCAATKLVATAAAARSALQCHGQAAAKGRAVSTACIAGAEHRATDRFAKADRATGCEGSGDGAAVATALSARAAAAAILVRPGTGKSKCAAAILKAAGQGAQALYKARAKQRERVDLARLQASRTQARTKLQHVLTRTGGCGASDAAALVAIPETVAGLAGTLYAHIEAAKAARIGSASRADVLSQRDALAAQGLTVAADGSLLTGTSQPAGGWLLVLGTSHGRSDAEGLLAIDVGAATALEGQVFHPSDSTFAVGAATLDDLTAAGETPRAMSFLITNQGPCGMNESAADDPPVCHAAGALAASRVHDQPAVSAASTNPNPASFPPFIEGPLGTYPNPDPNALQVSCASDDGPLPDVGPLAYFGSTCNIQVNLGCCDNEQADIARIGLTLIDKATFPLLHCKQNHKGRLCQSVKKGDVSVQVRGEIQKPGQLGTYEVQPSEVVPLTVHNNGCYNETHVARVPTSFVQLGGQLSGDFLAGDTILHYAGSTYRNDQTLVYTTPTTCPAGVPGFPAADTFSFETDGYAPFVRFYCQATTTTTLACAAGSNGLSACAPQWTGTFRHVLTIDDVGSFSGMNETQTRDDHLRVEDIWTFVSTTAAPPPDTFDTITATWTGSYSRTTVDTDAPPACLGDTTTYLSFMASGLSSGTQEIVLTPSDAVPGQISLGATGPMNSIPWTGTQEETLCSTGPRPTMHPSGGWDEATYAFTIGFLSPDPGDPNHYAGRYTLSHTETPGLGDGMRVYDDSVEWDIRRGG